MRILLFFIFTFVSWKAYPGIDCRQLNTNEKIIDFVHEALQTNPLASDNISSLFESLPCEKEICSPKNQEKRLNQKEVIHIVRKEKNKRLNFIRGNNSPQCFVKRDERSFKCSSCDQGLNNKCRSYKLSENSTQIRGTNIDSADFDLLENPDYKSVCEPLPKLNKYLKITSITAKKDYLYPKIITFYHREKKFPITINYFQKTFLAKVYRFYPQHYVNIKGHWYSTYFRSRTTQGKENLFSFETIIRVLKKEDGTFHIYPETEGDPLISKGNNYDIFTTN